MSSEIVTVNKSALLSQLCGCYNCKPVEPSGFQNKYLSPSLSAKPEVIQPKGCLYQYLSQQGETIPLSDLRKASDVSVARMELRVGCKVNSCHAYTSGSLIGAIPCDSEFCFQGELSCNGAFCPKCGHSGFKNIDATGKER